MINVTSTTSDTFIETILLSASEVNSLEEPLRTLSSPSDFNLFSLVSSTGKGKGVSLMGRGVEPR